MAIIKLTDFANEKTKYYVNIKSIESFYVLEEGLTYLITVGNCFRVKETPEEILALIKEAENGK